MSQDLLMGTIHALKLRLEKSNLPLHSLLQMYSPMSSSPSLVITLGSALVTTSMDLFLGEGKGLVSYSVFSLCRARCI